MSPTGIKSASFDSVCKAKSELNALLNSKFIYFCQLL